MFSEYNLSNQVSLYKALSLFFLLAIVLNYGIFAPKVTRRAKCLCLLCDLLKLAQLNGNAGYFDKAHTIKIIFNSLLFNYV